MAVDLPHDHARLRPAVPPRADRRDRRLTGTVPTPTELPPRDPPPGWTAGPVDDPERPRLRFELLAMLLLAAVPSFIIGLQGINDPTTVSTDIGVLELLATVAAQSGLAVMAVYLLWRDGRLQSSGFARRDAGFVAGYGAIGWVCCFIALLAVGLLIGIVYGAFGGDLDALYDGTDDDGVALTAASLVIAGVIALTAGLTEEVVFRAYAITRLEELGWKRAALVVPGAIFTLLHLYQGVLALLSIGAITCVFTWLYKWRRSIWPVMAAHALFDAVQLLLAALSS